MSLNWRSVVASGALWTMVYNLVWGLAWFAFMRGEWQDAMATTGRLLPWTAEVWFLWAVLTVPIGVAVMAHAADRNRAVPASKRTVSASLAAWALLTMGMAGWGWQDSLPIRVIAIDSMVNLVAMIAAAAAGAWSQNAA